MSRFAAWLRSQGAEVLAPTSEWELLRFRSGLGTGIVYTDAKGQLTWTAAAKQARAAWKAGDSLPGKPKKKRRQPRDHVTIKALFHRDGKRCFFCPTKLTLDDATIEHLVPLTCGGTNHIANKALACAPCNSEAGHLSVMEKIKMRERKKRQQPAAPEIKPEAAPEIAA